MAMQPNASSDNSVVTQRAGSPDVLRLLGRATRALRVETLPAEVLQRTKQRILDTIACLVAGYDAGIADTLREHVLSQGGVPEATLLPRGERTTAALAGFAHAGYIFGLELSDAAPRGTAHPGCEIVAIALALAERHDVGGAAIIPAVLAGYEVEIRFGRAMHPHAFYRGWSTIGLLGAIGPAVTAAHMLGLDADRIAQAIAISLNLAPCATGRAHQPKTMKWVLGGHACATGLLSAEMAGKGVTGLNDPIGEWVALVTEKNHPERLSEGIADDGRITQWELLSGIVTKYYATVGPMAAPLEATFRLLAAHDVRTEDIREILVDCTRRTAIFDKAQPENELAARGAMPYCLAVAVCTRDPGQLLGPAYRPEALRNPAYRALAEKVRITSNEDYERQYPARSLARVTLKMGDGSVYSEEVDRSEIPRYLTPTDADIEEKFRLIATPVLGQAQTDTVVRLVGQLEDLADVSAIMAALQPPR